MTLEFAVKEAKRRTEVLGTEHHVIISSWEDREFLVVSRVPKGHSPVYSIFPDGSELES
jgi:hypothetical protein